MFWRGKRREVVEVRLGKFLSHLDEDAPKELVFYVVGFSLPVLTGLILHYFHYEHSSFQNLVVIISFLASFVCIIYTLGNIVMFLVFKEKFNSLASFIAGLATPFVIWNIKLIL